jgi:hypothetical protein
MTNKIETIFALAGLPSIHNEKQAAPRRSHQ